MEQDNDEYRQYGDSCSGVYPPETFEGEWVETWPNGTLKYRGYFSLRRKRIGIHISVFENGVIQEVSYWNNGFPYGTILTFRDNGTKESEKDFGDGGGKSRSWTERRYSISGKYSFTHVYKDDEIVEESAREELQEILDEIDVNKIVDDVFDETEVDK